MIVKAIRLEAPDVSKFPEFLQKQIPAGVTVHKYDNGMVCIAVEGQRFANYFAPEEWKAIVEAMA